MIDKLTGILKGIAIIFGIIIIYFLLNYISKLIFNVIQDLIWLDNDVIYISPSTFSFHISFISLILLPVCLFQFIKVLLEGINFNKRLNKERRLINLFLIYSLLLCGVLLPILSVFNNKVFYDDKILVRSGIPLGKEVFHYENVERVNVSRFKGVHYNSTKYELVMKCGEKINLTTDDQDIPFIYVIEDKISDELPHIITKEAYQYIIKRTSEEQFIKLNWEIVRTL
ncbi:hypothetical protein KJ966_08865 [bacterium]|nr:hypothetical protein [bacterium]